MLTISLGIAMWMMSRGRNTVTMSGGLMLYVMTIICDCLLFIALFTMLEEVLGCG